MVYKNNSFGAPGGGGFTDGNPGGGVPATRIVAEFMNMLQEELVNTVEGAGLTLDDEDNTQLSQAIQLFVGKTTRKDFVVNGAFDVWQEATSISGIGAAYRYTADCWRIRADAAGGSGSGSAVRLALAIGDLPAYVGARYALSYQQSVAATLGAPRIETTLEDVRRFAGVERCFSLWIKAQAPTNATLSMVQTFGAGGSPDVNAASVAVNLTTDYQRFQLSALLPDLVGKSVVEGSGLVLAIELPTGAIPQVSLAAVQAEAGLAPSDFEMPDPARELMRCKRYFETSLPPNGLDTPPGTSLANAVHVYEDAYLTGPATMNRSFVAQKRIAPTMTWFNPNSGAINSIRRRPDGSGGTDLAVTGTLGGTTVTTGYPLVTTSGAATYSGHWKADARF